MTNQYFLQNWYAKRVRKILVKMSTTDIIDFNSKFKVTCKNRDFERCFIMTHTEEKPSKISSTTFTILLPQQKKSKTNGHPDYSEICYS